MGTESTTDHALLKDGHLYFQIDGNKPETVVVFSGARRVRIFWAEHDE